MSLDDKDKWAEEKAKEFLIRANVAIQTPEAYRQQLQIAKDFILSIKKELTPVVSKEWVYYFCAYINAGHKSPADDEARVGLAIKKLRDIGVEVISDKGSK